MGGFGDFVIPLIVGWVDGDLGRFDGQLAGLVAFCPITVWLISREGKLVLFDTGGGSPRSAVNRSRQHYHRAPNEVLERRLAEAAGLQPHDIDAVVLSHLHWDHAGGVGVFAPERVHVQQAEVTYAATVESAEESLLAALPRDWNSNAWNLVRGTTSVAHADLRTVSLPGHTPGSQGLVVGTVTGMTVLLAGDAVPLASNLRPPHAGAIATNKSEADLSIVRADAMADLVLPSHDPAVAPFDGLNILEEQTRRSLVARLQRAPI